jgi:hypothetical protein
MDETLRELVSRYSDEDLDDEEAARLEERARTDAELAAEIRTESQLREAVAALAAGMEPPEALDRVMEPLRQSAPVPAQRVRPVYRWLGVAAAMVLGVTVAMEMARRNPAPSLSRPSPQRDRPVAEREEIFELAPLPTANPDDNRPLGAVDRLLEEVPPQPLAPEPAPLEVMGPLPTDTFLEDAVEPSSSPDSRVVPESEGLKSTVMDSPDPSMKKNLLAQPAASEEAASVAPAMKHRSRAAEDREVTARVAEAGKAGRGAIAGQRQVVMLEVVVRIDGTEVWTGSSSACAVGTWAVRIEIIEHTVVAAEPRVGGAKDEAPRGCMPSNLIGAILDDVRDGIYLAEIVVHPN